MIVGNVAEYIDRCLTSFAPIADEICVVRAIGNQTPDSTVDIAAKKFGAKVAEYKNAPGHEDWPHVDNFAAARQQSFDMASGDYCFWCDSDDILEAGADVVRELANRGGYASYLFPYRIFARGVTLFRDRMMTKESGKWRYPVHECFDYKIQPVQGVQDSRVIVTHMPHFFQKAGSNTRNLRILKSIPEDQMTAGLLYHLQGEQIAAGDIPASIETAKRALAMPDLGTPERYEIFLNLAKASTDPQVKESLLIQAYQADPRRREALALLTCNSLDYQKNDNALAFARQMIATRRPDNAEWNERAASYGWLGDEIYTQALRANGFLAEADIIRRERLKSAGGPKIALIHATRGRPQLASYARKIWLDFAEEPDRIEHIFVFDQDDKESLPLARMHHLAIKPGGGCVAAWNAGAFVTDAPIVVQMSDDWTPPPQWDKLICERIGDVTLPKVLAVNDGVRGDQLLCMAICTRRYLQEDGFFFHPSFTGVYSDNWFTDLAYDRGVVVWARDLEFEHSHPVKTGKPMDETYQAQNSPERYKHGSEVYDYLKSGRDWSSIPGFMNYWMFYQHIAEGLKDGDVIAEVGVWLGRSVTYMAQALQRMKKCVKILAVDHFKGEAGQIEHKAVVESCNLKSEFTFNLRRCGVDSCVEIIEGDSADSAARVAVPLAFCFIDAAHDYDSVKRDIAAWRIKVKPGGILAGHDAQYDPVLRAVKETFPTAQVIGSVWMVQL